MKVILPAFASITTLVDFFICVLVISHPAILPPENITADPVISPLPFKLKFEAEIKWSVGPAAPDIKKEGIPKVSGPCIALGVILNPPICPEFAVIFPEITASEACNKPLEEIAKLDPKCT